MNGKKMKDPRKKTLYVLMDVLCVVVGKCDSFPFICIRGLKTHNAERTMSIIYDAYDRHDSCADSGEQKTIW